MEEHIYLKLSDMPEYLLFAKLHHLFQKCKCPMSVMHFKVY